MSTFDADTTEINAFELEDAELYIFSQSFDQDEVFDELREYYGSGSYRHEMSGILEDELVDLLAEIVARETVNPPGNEDMLANYFVDRFEAYRHSDGFNELSIIIDNSDRDRSTLIIHIEREQPAESADRVEAFLRDHGARTQRERHADADIRVLATLD